jgi:hypothetical protein
VDGLRTFREKSVLTRQLAEQERTTGNPSLATRFAEQAVQAEEYASLILKHVLNGTGSAGKPPEPAVENMEP